MSNDEKSRTSHTLQIGPSRSSTIKTPDQNRSNYSPQSKSNSSTQLNNMCMKTYPSSNLKIKLARLIDSYGPARNISCLKKRKSNLLNVCSIMVVVLLLMCTIGNVFFMASRLDDHLVSSTSDIDRIRINSGAQVQSVTDTERRGLLTRGQSLEKDGSRLLQALSEISHNDSIGVGIGIGNRNSDDNNYIEQSNVFLGKNTSFGLNSITLVTQGDMSRFPHLLHLLQRWQGPISCAMYITTEEELNTWYEYVKKQANNTLFQKYVSLHLVFKTPSSTLYPINLLRNLALRNAKIQSDYVFLNDIDLMPQPQSHATILSLLQQHELSAKTFLILPAFERFAVNKNEVETENESMNLSFIPNDKSSLYEALEKEYVQPFHAHSPLEHGLTNYAKWYNATTIYDVEYGFKFEPYCIVKSQDLHDFYPNFRGFGWNKLEFFIEAHYRGYKFQVLPNHFVVHMDHDFKDTRNSLKDGNRQEAYPQFQRYLEERYGIPTTSSSEKELIKTSYRYRDTALNTTNFPCHYVVNREEEFNIIPHYNKLQRLNSLLKWLPTSKTSKYDITIVTMMHPSQAMFKRLEVMADRWSGQISVAVFIDSDDKKMKAKTKYKIKQFQSDHKDSFALRISFHLVVNLMKTREKDQNIFPRNVLRNVALDNAQTGYVLLLDMDFAPSFNAHDSLRKHLQSLDEKEMPLSSSTSSYALVVPAFQKSNIHGKNKELVLTKLELLQTMETNPNYYDIFLRKDKPEAHNASDYDRWAATESNEMYNVPYEADYEPYIVVKKDANLPPFWEHFSGFGRNKLQWIEELYTSGFKFFVVPDSFLVHKNHKKYGLRKVRPFIVDEYIWRFQTYIKEKYGGTLQDMKEVVAWGDRAYKKWETLGNENKTEEVSWNRSMLEISEKRDGEFATCMKIMKTKHL